MAGYGALGPTVASVSCLMAAVGAIRTTILGKGLWEPEVATLPRAPIRVSGVVAGVFVALIYAGSIRNPDFSFWSKLAAVICAASIGFFLADLYLRETAIFKCKPNSKAIIGGLWLTSTARDIVRGHQRAYDAKHLSKGQSPPASAKTFFCSLTPENSEATRLDIVWPPESRAAATITIVGAYMLWNALAVIAIALAGVLINLKS